MKRLLIIFGLLICFAGCSTANVKEHYETTPAKATSTGEGTYKYYRYSNGQWIEVPNFETAKENK